MVMWAAGEYQATLGASGAIFGLMGALLVLAVKVGGNVQLIGTWLVLNVVITFTFPNISWQGHLGGFVGGALVAATLVYAPRARRTTWQVAGLALIGVADRGRDRRPRSDAGRLRRVRSTLGGRPQVWTVLGRMTPL